MGKGLGMGVFARLIPVVVLISCVTVFASGPEAIPVEACKDGVREASSLLKLRKWAEENVYDVLWFSPIVEDARNQGLVKLYDKLENGHIRKGLMALLYGRYYLRPYWQFLHEFAEKGSKDWEYYSPKTEKPYFTAQGGKIGFWMPGDRQQSSRAMSLSFKKNHIALSLKFLNLSELARLWNYVRIATGRATEQGIAVSGKLSAFYGGESLLDFEVQLPNTDASMRFVQVLTDVLRNTSEAGSFEEVNLQTLRFDKYATPVGSELIEEVAQKSGACSGVTRDGRRFEMDFPSGGPG